LGPRPVVRGPKTDPEYFGTETSRERTQNYPKPEQRTNTYKNIFYVTLWPKCPSSYEDFGYVKVGLWAQEYSKLFQNGPNYSKLFQNIPVYSSPFPLIPANL
jgi:hypothetical protein